MITDFYDIDEKKTFRSELNKYVIKNVEKSLPYTCSNLVIQPLKQNF